MEFSTSRDLLGRPCLPTHHPRFHLPLTDSGVSPGAVPGEVPGLLERWAQVPHPCGVRHALAVVRALTACAVLAGATSLLAVGEWIADAPPQVLDRRRAPRPAAPTTAGPG